MKRWIVALALLSLAPLSSAHAATKSGGGTGNFRFSPFGLLVGYVNVDLDFAVSDTWSLGPSISYWKLSTRAIGSSTDISVTSYAFGLRGNWYYDGVYNDSFYVSPVAQYVGASATSGSATGSANAFKLSAIAGYHWFWDSFNLNLGAGFGGLVGTAKVKVVDSTNNSTTEADISSTGGVVLDFMMGFVF